MGMWEGTRGNFMAYPLWTMFLCLAHRVELRSPGHGPAYTFPWHGFPLKDIAETSPCVPIFLHLEFVVLGSI